MVRSFLLGEGFSSFLLVLLRYVGRVTIYGLIMAGPLNHSRKMIIYAMAILASINFFFDIVYKIYGGFAIFSIASVAISIAPAVMVGVEGNLKLIDDLLPHPKSARSMILPGLVAARSNHKWE